jgi:hypothetical protein
MLIEGREDRRLKIMNLLEWMRTVGKNFCPDELG